jgi:hypothetical protein
MIGDLKTFLFPSPRAACALQLRVPSDSDSSRYAICTLLVEVVMWRAKSRVVCVGLPATPHSLSVSLSLEPWKRTLQISTSRRRRRWCATSRLLGGGLVRAFTRFVLACLVVISLELAQQGTDGGLPGCCVGGDRLEGSLGHIWESDTCGMQ